jgi:hypothetical protein
VLDGHTHRGMRLFEEGPGTDSGPAGHGESHFRYLRRTGRAAFHLVRDLVEEWLEEVPHPHRREMISRLRSEDNHHFEAAFFELYLHALFRRLQCSLRLHPRAGSHGRRPDFLVTTHRGARLLLEAATVEESSRQGSAERARLNTAFDALNRVSCPDYFLHLTHHGDLQSPLPGSRLRRQLERFISEQNYERVREIAAAGSMEDLPTMHFDHGSFSLEIALVPVSPARRGNPDHRPIGVLGAGEAAMVDDRTPIRDKIREKARRYGRLRTPLMIAVNASGRRLDKIDIMEALFGREQFVFSTLDETPLSEPRMIRRPDGAWFGPRGPQNRGVSAVLLVSSLLPWTVASSDPSIYHNPWARYPLHSLPEELEQSRPVGDQMVSSPGSSGRSILGLPEMWPRTADDS